MNETPETYVIQQDAPTIDQIIRTTFRDLADAVVESDQTLYDRIAALEAQVRDLKLATDPSLYSAKQVEKLLGITAPTRRELTLRGELPVVYIDSRPKYRKSHVEALVERKTATR